MKTKNIVVYSDPGHAWARVTLDELKQLNIHDKISSYSYMRKNYAYLEEDRDLSLLVVALKNIGITPQWLEKHTNKSSKIRSYDHYKFA